MTSHQAIAELAKTKGNAAYGQKDYNTARSLYTHAIAFDASVYAYPLNRAQANLNLGLWEEAIADADKAMSLSSQSMHKALFRRAQARKELGQFEEARDDLKAYIDAGGDAKVVEEEKNSITEAESQGQGTAANAPIGPRDLESALEKLRIDHDSPVYTIRDTSYGQKGAFALREFKRGDLILAEKPLFSIPSHADSRIPSKVASLSPVDFNAFLSLHNSHTTCGCRLGPLQGIFTTNSFALTNDAQGICVLSSRFNHSCVPNARYSFNAKTGKFVIHALGPISAGEEICVPYISGRNAYGTPRRERQAVLNTRQHFICQCACCALPEEESRKSDARRLRLVELWNRIPTFSQFQAAQRLGVIVEALRLLDEEGFWADKDDFTNDAGIVCAYHRDWESARYWAGLTYRTRVEEFGEDSIHVDNVRAGYLNPKTFSMAGQGPFKDFSDIRV